MLVAITLFTIGCGQPAGPAPIAVSGKIKLDGKPMSDGDIYFQPTDGRVPVRAKILDGIYAIQAPPGEYRVSIQQERDSGTKNMYGDPQMNSTIPARFNTETTLKAIVAADGPKTFDFEVESR